MLQISGSKAREPFARNQLRSMRLSMAQLAFFR